MTQEFKSDFSLYLKVVGVAVGAVVVLGLILGVTSTSNSTEPVKPVYDPTSMEHLIHEKVNEYRINNNLEPLSFDQELAAIARNHSQDMMNRDYFEHWSPEGLGFEHRYEDAGYVCEINLGDKIGLGGENISEFDDNNSNTFQEDAAQDIVDGWMNSPGHRQNILTDYYSSQGIGVAVSDGLIKATQNFC